MADSGDLERAVMEALWSAAEGLTARQVLEVLPGRRLALTTVHTVLERLRAKRLVVRQSEPRPYVYLPAKTRETYVAELMLDALGQTPDRDAALSRFLGGASPADAAHLRRLLSRRGDKG